MKRKIFYLAAAAMALTVILFACRKEYILEIPVTSVSLNITTETLNIGNTLTLLATVEPADADDKSVSWASSYPTIASVSQNGIVTALSPGTTSITVTTTDGEFQATCVVTVNSPVSGVTLNKSTLSLVEGASEQLTATVTPNNASNKDVTWTTSNPAVAVVSSNGLVTAVAPGTTPAIITATTADGGKTATCTVTVTAAVIPVTGVTLNESTLEMSKGTTSNTLIAKVWPENATNQAVTWSSSNASIVSVNSTNGVISAHAAGSATITATSSADATKKASCLVTVIVPVASITLTPNALTLKVDSTRILTTTILPADATNTTVNWTSSNSGVATIANNGEVKGINPGIATIVATTADGGKTAICNVTVESNHIPVTSVTLPATLTLAGSNTGTLTATVLPTSASNPSLSWTSSDETVAKVVNGVVTPEPPAPGITTPRTATITAISDDDNTKKATCTVTITYVAVTAVEVTPATLELEEDEESEELTAIVTPPHASIKAVEWSSSDSSIAGVSKTTGKVTAFAAGTATITAKSVADATKTDTCVVTVVPSP